MNFLFFSLSSLCQSLPPFFLKHRLVFSYSLIPSYFLPHHQFPSTPTPTPNPLPMPTPTPTHQFHANANANANTSLPRRSLSSCGFFFLAVVWWVGWAMGGFGWTDRWWVGLDGSIGIHHAAAHLTLSDQIALFFFFGGRGLSFMGFNGLMLVGYGGGWADFHGLWWLMLVGMGWFWVLVDFGF